MTGIGSGLNSPRDPADLRLITSGRPEKNMPFASPVATVGTIVFVMRSLPPRSFKSAAREPSIGVSAGLLCVENALAPTSRQSRLTASFML